MYIIFNINVLNAHIIPILLIITIICNHCLVLTLVIYFFIQCFFFLILILSSSRRIKRNKSQVDQWIHRGVARIRSTHIISLSSRTTLITTHTHKHANSKILGKWHLFDYLAIASLYFALCTFFHYNY